MDDNSRSTATPPLVAVIMAGGAGTRFWPLSTPERPKQFLELFGGRSLLRMSRDRLAGIVLPERILVLTSQDFIPLVREQLPDIPPGNIIGEPCRRDTAAAVALAACLARARFGDPVMAVLTADHLIEPDDAFQTALLSAAHEAAREPVLYTFGIEPTYPATTYGYLERGRPLGTIDGLDHCALAGFTEKPAQPTARRYVESGMYLWNSGMFVWRTSAIIAELERTLPDHIHRLSEAVAHDRADGWDAALAVAFESLPGVSIDYGVMEKARDVRCVAARFSWSDVGGWLAMREHLRADDDDNAHRCSLKTLDAHGNIVFCEDAGDSVSLIGVDDLVIVRAGNRLLVARADRIDDIKKLAHDNT